MIAGDLNARVACGEDWSPELPCLPRSSEDLVADPRGALLLRFCQEQGPRTVNGRVAGDTAGARTIVGARFTSSAVVDYLLLPGDWLHLARSLGVSPEPVVSDHGSLVVALAAAAAHRPMATPPPGSHDPCLARFPSRPPAAELADAAAAGWLVEERALAAQITGADPGNLWGLPGRRG